MANLQAKKTKELKGVSDSDTRQMLNKHEKFT